MVILHLDGSFFAGLTNFVGAEGGSFYGVRIHAPPGNFKNRLVGTPFRAFLLVYSPLDLEGRFYNILNKLSRGFSWLNYNGF